MSHPVASPTESLIEPSRTLHTIEESNSAVQSDDSVKNVPDRRAALWLLFVLLTFVSAVLLNPTGWLGSDDAGYFSAAEYVTTGTTITRAHHHYVRLAVSLPIAVSIAIFGAQPWSVILPTFLASLGCVVVVAVIGRQLWGWTQGLIAAALLITVPYFTTLSTAAYPDAVVCFWASLSVLIALVARRAPAGRRHNLFCVLTGLTFAVALSAKVLVAPVLLAVIYILMKNDSRRFRGWVASWIALSSGLIVGLAIEAAIFSVVADDALFRWRALLTTQSNTSAVSPGIAVGGYSLELIVDRLTLPFRHSESGWGWIGVTFWPVMLLCALWCRCARPLVLWAVIPYFSLAFVPVDFGATWRPFPNFHGRHLLPSAVPLVLCMAWLIGRGWDWLRSVRQDRNRTSGAAVIMALLLAMGLHIVSRGDIAGFVDRDTSRIARSIEQMIAAGAFDGDQPVFMTPSTYWRYRILFPPSIQNRLRVVVDSDSPEWWRDVCVDITTRVASLPLPGEALLLATPSQLRGNAEFWDYGVTPPRTELELWRHVDSALKANRGEDRSIVLSRTSEAVAVDKNADYKAILVLLGLSADPDREATRLSQGP